MAAHPYLARDRPLELAVGVESGTCKLKKKSRDGSATQEEYKLLSFDQSEIGLDPNSIRNHLRDSVRNCSSRKTQLYFESESLLNILESMIIDNYSGRALSHVLARAREVLAASWPSWSFVRKSTNAAKLQSLAFPVDTPKAEPVYQSYRQGQNGRRVVRRKWVVKYQKSKKSSES